MEIKPLEKIIEECPSRDDIENKDYWLRIDKIDCPPSIDYDKNDITHAHPPIPEMGPVNYM